MSSTEEPTSEPVAPAQPELTDVPSAEELSRIAIPATVRRAPRYRAFVVAGAVLGLLVAVVVVLLGLTRAASGTDPRVGVVLGFVGAALALVGAALGAVLAVLVDRRSHA